MIAPNNADELEGPLTLKQLTEYFCLHMNNGLKAMIIGIANGKFIPITSIDDVAQEVFLKIHKAALRNPHQVVDKPNAYLARTIYRGCTDYHRKHKKKEGTNIDWGDESYDKLSHHGYMPQEPGPVTEAIDRLNPKQREAMYLHYWLGLSFKEMADKLDVPVKTLLSRTQRGRQIIHEYLTLRPEYARLQR